MEQNGTELTVRSGAAQPQRYKTDGTEFWTAISSEPCSKKSRVTKTAPRPPPSRSRPGSWRRAAARTVRFGRRRRTGNRTRSTHPEATRRRFKPALGTRRTLESVTVVERNGNRLTVETTRSVPGGLPASARTEYTRRTEHAFRVLRGSPRTPSYGAKLFVLWIEALSGRPRPLRIHIERVERLARGHEEPVALGAAEAEIAAHFGQANPADELAVRRPHRDAAVAHVAPGVARAPDVAVHVAADAVRTAADAVNAEIGERLVIGQLVVRRDVEHAQVAACRC